MVWRWLSLVFLVGAVVATPAIEENVKVRFDGFRVYRVRPTSEKEVAFLKELEKQDNGLSFWSGPILNGTVDIMVSPYLRIDFRDLAKAGGLDPEIFIEDVQKLIDKENPRARADVEFGWKAYYPLSDLNAWLESLPDVYDNVDLIEYGKSYEDHALKAVKISSGKVGNKIIFVESGIHAREWITGATATYLINKLLTSSDQQIKNLVENFDWYIVPITNPDGYDYTHRFNRLWRKTRSPGEKCSGADPNRNWDYEWDNDEGSSDNECSETYRGSAPFSEPETKSLSEYLENEVNEDKDLLVYFCLHSYSQVLMVPYGLKADTADNYKDLEEIGEKAIAALEKRNGTKYEFGDIRTAIRYDASGGSMDWVKKNLDIKYTFEWELRDKGKYGFLLPANQIIDTAEETIDSMVNILEQVQEKERLLSSR